MATAPIVREYDAVLIVPRIRRCNGAKSFRSFQFQVLSILIRFHNPARRTINVGERKTYFDAQTIVPPTLGSRVTSTKVIRLEVAATVRLSLFGTIEQHAESVSGSQDLFQQSHIKKHSRFGVKQRTTQQFTFI